MFNISVENHKNPVVYTITSGNREMNDVQDGLNVKNISGLVSKEFYGIYGTKNPTKEQTRKYKHFEKGLDKECNSNCKYALSVLITRIGENCRGAKRGERR